MNIDTLNVVKILNEAKVEARNSALELLNEEFGGQDSILCGFAWMEILSFNQKRIDGRSKVAKVLRKAGIEYDDYAKKFVIRDPSNLSVQNVDVKRAGAQAAANVFNKYGFTCIATSRLD